MKKLVLLTMVLMLTGCGAAETFETVNDEPVAEVISEPREMHYWLAQDPVMPAMESDEGTLYLCGDYDVMAQTMPGGDLSKSVYRVSGYTPEELTLIQTGTGDIDKYEFVWTSATESGHQIGRATLLDDGEYHYVLSATVDAELMEEYQEIWNGIFESFQLN